MKAVLKIEFAAMLCSTLVLCQTAKQKPPGLHGPSVGQLPFVCVQPQSNQEEEREIVARTISSVIGWAKDKNLDLFYSVICHDTDYVSVSPGKRVVKRFEDVKQNVPFWMSPDFKYVRHELRDLRITFSRGGDVAWFYCILDDINTYEGRPASWENARWTGVVEKRDGRWVVVQQHFSFAKEN
jgi:ketosteroid isomerase-like protein